MSHEKDMQAYRREVGRRLKAAREAVGLTQGQAAEGLGQILGSPIPDSRIGNYEQGTRLPDPLVVQHICALYGTSSPAEVLALAGTNDVTLTPQEHALLNTYRATDDRGKRVIQSVAESQPVYDVSPGDQRKAS